MTHDTDNGYRPVHRLDATRVYDDLRRRQKHRERVAAMLATRRAESARHPKPALFVTGRPLPATGTTFSRSDRAALLPRGGDAVLRHTRPGGSASFLTLLRHRDLSSAFPQHRTRAA
jgi:hypothetical protein